MFEEINRCVPENVVLTVFKGHDTVAIQRRMTKQEKRKAAQMLTKKKGGKAKIQKDVVISGAVRVKPNQQSIPEITEILNALRSSKLLAATFPVIGGADLSLKEIRTDRATQTNLVAQFSVKCQHAKK